VTAVTSEPVDDRLFVELRHAGAPKTRAAGDEPDAANIPLGLKFATSAPGGHRDGSFSYLRDPRLQWSDLELVDEAIIYGRTKPLGRNAFEGMTDHFPSELGDGYSIGVNLVGNQVLLDEDESWKAIYVALGFGGWGEASLALRQVLANAGLTQGKIPVSIDGGLIWDVPVEDLPATEVSDVVYSLPAGLRMSKVGYRGARKGTWTNFASPSLFGGDSETFSGEETVGLTLDSTARVATFAQARQHAALQVRVISAHKPAGATQQSFDRLAVYGDHGLTLRDVAGELPGVYGHDALAHMLDTGAPELNYSVGASGTIVPNTSVVLSDLSFPVAGKVSEALLKLNAYFLNNWAVWDNRTFHWHPWDPDRLTWKVRIAGGAHWTPTGRKAETLLNGVIVSYNDHAGRERMAGPPGSGCDVESELLRDTDPRNPYTRRGRRRWGKLQVDFPLPYGSSAVQVGHVFLLEHRLPQRAGRLTIRPLGPGHVPQIEHPTIGAVPIWALRAGDFAELVDWPEPEPFRIIETDYDHDSKTMTAQLDTGSPRLSAILERVGMRLTGMV